MSSPLIDARGNSDRRLDAAKKGRAVNYDPMASMPTLGGGARFMRPSVILLYGAFSHMENAAETCTQSLRLRPSTVCEG